MCWNGLFASTLAQSTWHLTQPGTARAAALERALAAEREEALLRSDAALLREFAESDAVTVDGTTIAATCAPQPAHACILIYAISSK